MVPLVSIGGLVDAFSFAIESDDHDKLLVDDMGECTVVLSQRNEAGKVERVAVSLEQLNATMARLASRYGCMKNTDHDMGCELA